MIHVEYIRHLFQVKIHNRLENGIKIGIRCFFDRSQIFSNTLLQISVSVYLNQFTYFLENRARFMGE